MARSIMIAAVLAFLMPAASYAGSCDHSWQSASDGSKCGSRSADSRYGGK